MINFKKLFQEIPPIKQCSSETVDLVKSVEESLKEQIISNPENDNFEKTIEFRSNVQCDATYNEIVEFFVRRYKTQMEVRKYNSRELLNTYIKPHIIFSVNRNTILLKK